LSKRAVHELLVVFKDDLRQGLTSPLTLFLAVSYLLFSLLITLPYVALSRLLMEKLATEPGGASAAAALQVAGTTMWSQAFTQLTGSPEEGLALASVPLPALYTFFFASFIVPLLAVLLSSDLVADDLRTGHMRYLTLRCGRETLLGGRLLSRCLLLAATTLLGTGISFALFAVRLTALSPSAYVHFLRYGLFLAGSAVVYAALAALCSTLVRSAFFALVLGIFLLLIFGVVDMASDVLGWATPNAYKLLLFSPNRWPQGLAAYLGFATLYAGAAWLRLRTRDL